MDAAREKFGLDEYFSKYFVGEYYDYLDKYKILRKEINGDYIMVGDRKEDIEAGLKNNQKTIFASYGYGNPQEGDKADYKIDNISQLREIL